MTNKEMLEEHKKTVNEMASRAKSYGEIREEIADLRDHMDKIYRLLADKNAATNNGYACTSKMLNMISNNTMELLSIMSIEADRVGE